MIPKHQSVFTFSSRNVILKAMKKTNLFLILLLSAIVLYPKNTIKIGAYAGYFRSNDSLFTDIYKGEDVIYGLKLGIRVWNNLSVWVSGYQFKQNGETTELNDSTTLQLNPIHLSLRYTFKLGAIKPYLEGGYSYIHYKETSDIGDSSGNGSGYSIDAGLEIQLSSHFMIDLGAKYTDCKVQTNGEDIQLGGAQAGLAFLVVF